MKKSVKRFLCGALSLGLATTLVAEYALRAGNAEELSSVITSDVAFENVTGKYDTGALSQSNFNADVLKTEKPTYETRSVIVSLKGENLIEAAEGEDVSSFIDSFAGQKAVADVRREQNAFLKELSKAGISYTYERSYNTVLNAVAIEVNTKYVSAIKKMAGVDSVVISTTYSQPETFTTSSADTVTNATSVYDTGIYQSGEFTTDGAVNYGAGTVVAVLDTGLDYTHNAFQTPPTGAKWSKSHVEKMLAEKQLAAETKSGTLSVNDVYVSSKVPFAYDYADNDADVYPSYSNHGTHVAGIIGGYDESGYTDKDGYIVTEDDGNGNETPVAFRGVVPDTQLVICKVFTDDLDSDDLGGAIATDIIAALDDCVALGVDVINMSLGTSCGFTTTDDGDDEGILLNGVYEDIKKAGISLVCAASNDYSSGYGGAFGTNLTSNPDSGTVGSPSTFSSALSVASISGQKSPYMVSKSASGDSYVFYEESRDENGNPYDFAEDMLKLKAGGEFEYVVVPGTGSPADYSTAIKEKFKDGNGNSLNRIALVKRGASTFKEKVETAMQMGAVGVIVYNNVAGIIRMNLGEIENPVPSVSISMDAGSTLVSAAVSRVGTVVISDKTSAGPFMSEFSSWGPTHDLKLKPEITAHGGEITSTVPGGYGEQSGTSMASPNMAGVMALVRSYIKSNPLLNQGGDITAVEINRLANQLIMSTATTARDQQGKPYSPRKQGAGLASLENVIKKTNAYLYTDSEANDYRPKFELGDDPQKTGEYTVKFSVKNFGSSDLTFATSQLVFTETHAADEIAVAEQAYALNPEVSWSASKGMQNDGTIVVGDGESVDITVQITLSDADIAYLEKLDKNGSKIFANGMYVEGFLQLKSSDSEQCDLSLPFLGFYGDWYSAPMLDYTAFEVAKDAQDPGKTDEEKIQASVWATQPYSQYYNEKFILPMGGYVYLLDENDEKMYANEEYCAVSRYNNYYGEDDPSNYMSSTAIKAVYAGLLRNARLVRYKMTNVQTGEEILSGEINRVGKAYSGGGAATPANVELNISPEEYELLANGQYRMDFEFFAEALQDDEGKYILDANGNKTYPEHAAEENTYSFTFTVDYEAPVLEDVRIRYYNYKDGTKEKQRIYLDVDVFDNHYPQAVLLCYPDEENMLNLVTEYPTPVRNPIKNGTNTVSIDITDIYEKYQGDLYIQVDDYAVNSCLYQLDLNAANASVLPEGADFALATGEDVINLGLYETHKVNLVYSGEADLSNFKWESTNEKVAKVKNGEIVGLAGGTATVKVSNRKGVEKKITVNVSSDKSATLAAFPSISFGLITTDTLSLTKATGVVPVHAGQSFKLTVEKDPWYHPKNLQLIWESKNPEVATVDQNGNVKTLKKGVAIITATNAEERLYTASVTLNVQNEFTVSNYTLQDYNGVGYNEGNPAEGTDILVVPSDLNIMYIGEDAFKDNDTVRRIVIPSSVVEIHENAFVGCTALEEVYFVSVDPRENASGEVVEYGTNEDGEPIVVDWSDLSLINRRAFYGCTALKKVDLSNVKVITVAQEAFAGCTSLSTVVDMASIGTMHHRAFQNSALTSVDLTGLFVSGDYVFEGCKQLATIKTGKFTNIGRYMFKDCTGLESTVKLSAPKIGEHAFSGCTALPKVVLQSSTSETLEVDIGAYAFENCGSERLGGKGGFTFDVGNAVVRSLGDNVFAGTTVATLAVNDSFEISAFARSGLTFNGAKKVTVTLADGYSGTTYEDRNGVIIASGKDAQDNSFKKIVFVNATVAGSYEVPADVTAIGSYSFANGNVTSVKLHNGVTEIGEGAFAYSQLATVDFNGAGVEYIFANAFRATKLSTLTLPATVTELGDYAFAESNISALTADGLTKLGNAVFYGCKQLETITIVDTVSEMGSHVFANCTILKTVTLPSVKKLGGYTFSGATALDKVVFGERAETTGEYTFMGTPITKVTLSESMTEIGMGAFDGCGSLVNVSLPQSVTKVGAFAFSACDKLTTVTGLDRLTQIGSFAFYNTALTSLTLTSTQEIGYGAFAAADEMYARGLRELDENDTNPLDNIIPLGGWLYYYYLVGERTAAYNNATLELPAVETIGAYAFLNSGASTIALPQTVKEIGAGAFASSANLSTITLSKGNEYFTVKDNVLYRYIGGATSGEYEIVCYPAARAQAATDNVKVYRIIDGTLTVAESAFYGLNSGVIDEVVLPYSVNSIGDAAFFNSGIKTYTFESIVAPALETIYRAEIEMQIQNKATEVPTLQFYKGYYYSNFETYLLNFTAFAFEKQTSKLEIKYPVNGEGYDNYIYRLYFGTRNTTKIEMTDNTRECLTSLGSMSGAETVREWLKADKTDAAVKAEVEAFAAQVQAVRGLYNNAIGDSTQAQFVTAADTEKLLAIEQALREVKSHFGIVTAIKELQIDKSSAHKSTYKVGETFDMTGLIVNVIYQDGSVVQVDSSKLTLITTTPLGAYDRLVVIRYSDGNQSMTGRIGVTITQEIIPEKPSTTPDSSDSSSSTEEESSEEKKGCKSSVGSLSVLGVGLAIAAVAVIKTKRSRKED